MICHGIHPFSFQSAVIDEVKDAKGTGKIVVAKSVRQVGKSTLIANLLLYYSINYYNTKNYCLSPTLKQGKKLYKTVVKSLTKAKLVKSANGSDLSIELTNESEIHFKSAEQGEALRGETVTGILCIDEMAYIPDDVYDIIKPWTTFHKAVTLMVSTPFIKEGYFWKYYNYGLEKSHNTVSVDWCDEKYKDDMNKLLPPSLLSEYEQLMPKKAFTTEFLGEFIDGGGLVFEYFKDVQKLVDIEEKDKLYVGIDWSNQAAKDFTVISIINQNGEQCKINYWNDLTPLKQIDQIYNTLKPYFNQIEVIICESNSIGTPYIDLFKERLTDVEKQKVKEFNTSNSSKNDLVGKMQVALEQRNISLLPDKKQEREFSFYACEYNPTTKTITYNAPSGLHDDTVMATMFAWYGFNEYKNNGNYKLSFGNKTEKKTKYKYGKYH